MRHLRACQQSLDSEQGQRAALGSLRQVLFRCRSRMSKWETDLVWVDAAITKASYILVLLLGVSALRASTTLGCLCTCHGHLGIALMANDIDLDYMLAGVAVTFVVHASVFCFALQSATLTSLILSMISAPLCLYLPFIISLEKGRLESNGGAGP